MTTIFDISKKLSNNYDSSIEITEGLYFSLKDELKQIEYISNSKYLSGKLDEFGREKPYYNITNYRVNVAIRATDFDTKDISIVSETRDYVRSLLISKKINNWMKENNFAEKLNRIGEKLPKYGWILLKKVIKDGVVGVDIVKHTNAIIDQSDPLNNPIKELHPEITREQLSSKKDIWDNDVIDKMLSLREYKYDIVEITGVMEDTIDKGESGNFSLYKFIIYEGKKDSYILYKKKYDDNTTIEDLYLYSEWANTDGRVGIGIIRDMFEAQTWTNEVKLLERDAMIMASKTGFVTDDDTLVNNIITDLDTGFVLNLSEGKTFTQVNTMTNALPAFDRLKKDWDDQAEKVTSTYDAVTGQTMPAATPFRSVAVQNHEASSLFIYRRENKGIFFTKLFNKWIIPNVIKDINQEWILSAEFSAEELSKIDERFGIYKANDAIKEKLLNLDIDINFDSESYQQVIDSFRELINETDNTRFVKVPKDYFKDFKFKISVITTNEQRNKAATLESLSNILGQVANTYDPNTKSFTLLDNPALSSIFSRAVELSGAGISPVTLNKLQESKGNKNIEPQKAKEDDLNVSTATEKEGVN